MSVETIGANTATSGATVLTNSGVANTKGGWTQLVASSSIAATGIIIVVGGGGATGDALFDIGVGASLSEVAVISNIHYRIKNTTINDQNLFYFPCSIASGSRISGRYQATSGSSTANMQCYLINDGGILYSGGNPVTYGANTGDSGATGVDPGGTINTKPATWTEIVASTTADFDWICVVVGNQNNDAIVSNATWLLDIATGAASSEVAILNNLLLQQHNGDDTQHIFFSGPFPITVASGTRLSARCQSSINDATDRLIDVQLICFNGTASGGGGGFSAAIH